MWWFVWSLSYLAVGSCLMGWVLSVAVKKGKFDPETAALPEIAASLVLVMLWPLMACLLIFMGIAYAAKDQKREQTKS